MQRSEQRKHTQEQIICLPQPTVGAKDWVSGTCYDPYKQPELKWVPKDGFMHGTLDFGVVKVEVNSFSLSRVL